MKDILEICVQIDRCAAQIYSEFALKSKDEDMNAFWNDMKEEEVEHIGFWQELMVYSDKNMLPDLFESPDRMKQELSEILFSVQAMKASNEYSSICECLYIACKLEFHMLHNVFGNLINFLKNIESEMSPEEQYEAHLDHLFLVIKKFEDQAPHLVFIVEILKRLWKENKALVIKNTTDNLTNVFNRVGFFQAATPLCYLSHRNKSTVGLLMIDIDHFKLVNDEYGHQAGDIVLANVAKIIKNSLRRSDIIARYGGEEFVVLLPELETNTIKFVGDKIRQAVQENIKDIPVTVSVGCHEGVFHGDIQEELQEFITGADKALYIAKVKGRNCTVAGNDK